MRVRLQMRRYSAGRLESTLGDGFEPIETRREEQGPGRAVQLFTWVAGRLAFAPA